MEFYLDALLIFLYQPGTVWQFVQELLYIWSFLSLSTFDTVRPEKADYSARDETCPPPAFVDKVLLEGHEPHRFLYCLQSYESRDV